MSCENKKIVFRTRDVNSSINIIKLTSWIKKQERPLCFQISSFTSSKRKINTIVGAIPTIDFTFFLIFLPVKCAFSQVMKLEKV